MVDLRIGQGVELVRRHHDGAGHIGGEQADLVFRRQDVDLLGDGARRLRVVAREHVHHDAGALACLDAGQRLGTRRIVDANEAAEREVAFEGFAVRRGAVGKVGFGHVGLVLLLGEREDSKTLSSQGNHVVENIRLDRLGEWL